MRLQLKSSGDQRHQAVASAVSWSGQDDLYSVGDDHTILSWNADLDDDRQLCKLGDECFPTAFAWIPTVGKRTTEMFVLASDDGKFRLMNKAGRADKTVEAHAGAITAVEWSKDASSFLTAGEDGHVKVWSRSGMVRSVLAQAGSAVYAASWNSDSSAVVYATGRILVVKPMQPNGKTEQWKAHDGVILDVDWGSVSNTIVSCGEDCRYKVWDSVGRALYSSGVHEHPIACVRWCPDGSLFAVGGYNTVRLCDAAGWSRHLDNTATGTVYDLSWSSDGTQLAGACADGQVFRASLVGRSVTSSDLEITQSSADTLTVKNLKANSMDVVEFRDPMVTMSLRFDHLVVITTTQALLYRREAWTSPASVELRSPIAFVQQSKQCIVLVDRAGTVSVYNYDGRLVSSPKIQGLNAGSCTAEHLSINDETLVIRDPKDATCIRIIDLQSGKELGKPIQHSVEVATLALEQGQLGLNTHLAIVDKNRDLFLVQPRRTKPSMEKLATMVQDMAWHGSAHMIAALLDGKLSIWFYPSACFLDRDVLPMTRYDKHHSELGSRPALAVFDHNFARVRRADGANLTLGLPAYATLLHELAASKKWSEAIRLARLVKERAAWACLAALATQAKDLNTAEIAYSAINSVDKVQQIQYIKSIPTAEGRNAEMALLCNQVAEAESLLLQAGLTYRAIDMNCTLCRWDRALSLAVKHKTHVDTVIGLRQRYLKAMDQPETNVKFIEYSSTMEVDWDAIQSKIDAEWEAERARPGAKPFA
eukprot:TRINITY_DN10005_c0_g2_i4.p1 TRINITY_DN10005_c0_g2~~TRINITY_DN10005_c0_g2_i4.p1  ORF type:complete len:763 (+),score=166.92 TRINITY_DN10005_c0_g2_i4:103-2391(+)